MGALLLSSGVATRWYLLTILTGSYGAGAFGMLGISPLSPSLIEGFGLTRLQVALMDLFPAPERGVAMGIKQMGLTLGGIASALVLPRVAAALGWRVAFATCALVVTTAVALIWRPLGRLDGAAATAATASAAGAGDWAWARRPAILMFFASGLILGMVQAAVLSYLPLYTIQALGYDAVGGGACSQAGGAVSRLALGAASDRWLANQRSVWLALTGGVGAVIFAAYAFWPVSAPLGAGILAFLTGVGAYGWVGVFFVISAELGGSTRAGLLSGVAFASIVVGLLVGPATFGVLLEYWDSYAVAWAAFAALAAVVTVAALLVGPALERERP